MGVGTRAAQGRRIEPKKVCERFAPGRIVVGEDRRLVEPETLNEESGVRDDTPAVGASADDAQQRALRDWASRPAIAGNVPLGRLGSAEVGQRLVAQRREQRRHLRRLGAVADGQRERRAAGAARVQLQRQRRRRRRARCASARSGRQGNSKVAPLPSGRDLAPVEGRRAGDQRRTRPRARRARRPVAVLHRRRVAASTSIIRAALIDNRRMSDAAMPTAAAAPPRRWPSTACACSTCRASWPAPGARRRWPTSAPT